MVVRGMTMLAYNGDATFRRRFLSEIRAHMKADQILRGTYGKGRGDNWRGCAVGCSLRSVNRIKGKQLGRQTGVHARYPKELGIPIELAYLEDQLFERMPVELSKGWPLRFASAIRSGADLSLVWPRFSIWLLVDPTDGVIRFAKTDQQRDAIRGVAALFERQCRGEAITREEWQRARSAASAYAAASASAASAYAAASAAYASAYAADAAWVAAYAASAASADDAESQAYARQAEKLEELLRAAPVRRSR